MSDIGWRGLRVRNPDGRKGRIARERPDFAGVDLVILLDTGGGDLVRLNARSGDSGSPGWSWLCKNFSGGATWLPLGDHNTDLKAVRATPADLAPPVPA